MPHSFSGDGCSKVHFLATAFYAINNLHYTHYDADSQEEKQGELIKMCQKLNIDVTPDTTLYEATEKLIECLNDVYGPSRKAYIRNNPAERDEEEDAWNVAKYSVLMGSLHNKGYNVKDYSRDELASYKAPDRLHISAEQAKNITLAQILAVYQQRSTASSRQNTMASKIARSSSPSEIRKIEECFSKKKEMSLVPGYEEYTPFECLSLEGLGGILNAINNLLNGNNVPIDPALCEKLGINYLELVKLVPDPAQRAEKILAQRGEELKSYSKQAQSMTYTFQDSTIVDIFNTMYNINIKQNAKKAKGGY